MKKRNIPARSSTQMAFKTRLLGICVTIFILILTVKSELLEYKTITWQLVLAIPILFTSLIINSRIVDNLTFKHYRSLNLVVNSLSIALVFNAIGLLVSKYVSAIIGAVYFLIFIGFYLFILKKEIETKSGIINEIIIIILMIAFGLIPALSIMN